MKWLTVVLGKAKTQSTAITAIGSQTTRSPSRRGSNPPLRIVFHEANAAADSQCRRVNKSAAVRRDPQQNVIPAIAQSLLVVAGSLEHDFVPAKRCAPGVRDVHGVN
jgi:hypothetical protein